MASAKSIDQVGNEISAFRNCERKCHDGFINQGRELVMNEGDRKICLLGLKCNRVGNVSNIPACFDGFAMMMSNIKQI